MSEYLEAFILGNGAIIGNVCMLPLYPGLIAFLASGAARGKQTSAPAWLGVLVLSGILAMMLLVALALVVLRQSFGSLLPWLLPLIYGSVIVLGVLLLFGHNPFTNIALTQAPALRSPHIAAFVYGLLLGPMTLPCTGPLVVSALLLGSASAASLLDGMLYFLCFGLGFGWPLIVLPLLAGSLQRQLTRWLAHRHTMLARLSGTLLVAIGAFGIWNEVLPGWLRG